MIYYSMSPTDEPVTLEFGSLKEADLFSQHLQDLHIHSLSRKKRRATFVDGKFQINLTKEEYAAYQNANGEKPLHIFPEEIRKAVRWAQKEIFRHPYPFLTPWLDQSVPPKKGLCPKQLQNFETELDCGYGRKVVRPNHGMVHSIRVCNYMRQVCELFRKYSTDPAISSIVNDEKEVRILQIMMLFSVSGRVNEAGKAGYDQMNEEERKLSNRNYEESREFSAENFKRYCQETGLVDVKSEKFKTYFHAMRYMERRGDSDHNWNPYIHLMSLTHSMDLMRCFPIDWMKGLNQSFEAYFKKHTKYQSNPAKVRADIFKVLKNIEKSQRATGNRIMTGIDEAHQTYYNANQYYNYDLFYHCTEHVDYTMDQLEALQSPQAELNPTKLLPHLIHLEPREEGNGSNFYFEYQEEAVQFAQILYQEGLTAELKEPHHAICHNHEAYALSVSKEEEKEVLPFIQFKQVKVGDHVVTADLTEAGDLTAIRLIEKTKALAYLFNGADKSERDHFLKQVSNPRTYRPCQRDVTGDRSLYRAQRTGQLVQRKKVSYVPTSKQIPVVTPQNLAPRASTISFDQDRGKEKNTIFTKKLPLTLLRPDGRVNIVTIGNQYVPIGVLSSLDEVHQKGQSYIWQKRTYPFDLFWTGDGAIGKTRTGRDPYYLQERGKGVSLETLVQKLNQEAMHELPPSDPSELLMGLSKGSIKALFAPRNELLYRLALLENYLHMRENYKIDVPLLIIDGKHAPMFYSEDMIAEDLRRAINAFTSGMTVMDPSKDSSYQKQVISSLVNKLLIGPHEEATQRPIGDLAAYDQQEIINFMMNNLDIIGGDEREWCFYSSQVDHHNIATARDWLQRAIILKHEKIIRDLLDKAPNLQALLKNDEHFKPVELAEENGLSEISEKILSRLKSCKV